MSNRRGALLVIHPTRPEARDFAQSLAASLVKLDFDIYTNQSGLVAGAANYERDRDLSKLEVAIVLGGDGTILRGAELILGSEIPLVGINLGNVGFLAQVDQPTIEQIVNAIESKKFHGEPRLTISYSVERAGKVINQGWALNEVTIERGRSQMAELFVQIDKRPLSRWGSDGVICATPTGSTAYAFSAGGPVVWPEVAALILLPLAAHALYSRPMVISPDSEIVIDLESDSAEIVGDGIRTFNLIAGDRVTLSKSKNSIHLSYIENGVFTDRLVAKFKLPIEGWRGERA
jgi:NAD+ kinase